MRAALVRFVLLATLGACSAADPAAEAAPNAADAPTPAPVPPPAPAPAPAGETSLAARTQALIDRFIAAMPHQPEALRSAAERQRIAPAALPVLREVRAFVAAHPDCSIGDRVHEFTVFAVVLGDEDLRASLVQKAAAEERGAVAMLGAADAIVASDAEARAKALAALARGFAKTSVEVDCAVQCVVVAGELREAEARQLATSAPAGALQQRLQSVAERAARDPRHQLDQPFTLTGKLLDGSEFSSRSLLGKVVLVDFWATWCGPCVRSLPELVRLRQAHGDQLAIVGVDSDEDADELRAFLQKRPELDWPQLFAGARWHPLATELGVEALPRVFLIDRQGILRSVDAAGDLDALVRRHLAP